MKRNKNFNLLIGSQLFSVLGTTIVQFVISLYVLDITKSALTFSVIASLSIVGRLICLPFCGVLADRLPKRNLMLLMDCLYLVLSIGLFLVTRLENPVTAIGILTVIIGMVSAFETPVVQSAIPIICKEEEIPRANGIISSIGTLGTVLGPILAGIIYRFDAVYQIFMITAALFLIAIFCEVLLNIPVQLIVYIQLVSDKALLGRIMSLVMIVTTLAIPLGQVMYGSFAAVASTKMLLVLIIATSIVTILIAIFSIRIFKQMRVSNEV